MANSSSLLLSGHICLFSSMRARLSSLISIKWNHGVTDCTCLELQCTDDRNTAKAKKKNQHPTSNTTPRASPLGRCPLTVLPASVSHMTGLLTWMLIHNPPAPPPPTSLPLQHGVRVVVLLGRPTPPQKQVTWSIFSSGHVRHNCPSSKRPREKPRRKKKHGCHFLCLSTVIFFGLPGLCCS